MGPAVKPHAGRVKPAAEDEADVLAGCEEADRGESVAISEDELKRWADTGEWPERLA